MKRLHVHDRRSRGRLRTEHPGSPFQELGLPCRNLVGMNIKLLGEFGQRLLASHSSQSYLRLKGRAVVPARSSRHRLSCPAASLAAVRQKLHSSHLCRNPEPPLSSNASPPAPVSPCCRSRSKARRCGGSANGPCTSSLWTQRSLSGMNSSCAYSSSATKWGANA